MDCIFCKITNHESPSWTIYEDDLVHVFLDINPSTNGDLLLVPKKHIITVEDLDNDLIIHMHKISLEMKKLLEEKLNCDGLTIVQNNGHGQDVKHYHIHLTPRYINDELTHNFDKSLLKPVEEIAKELNN